MIAVHVRTGCAHRDTKCNDERLEMHVMRETKRVESRAECRIGEWFICLLPRRHGRLVLVKLCVSMDASLCGVHLKWQGNATSTLGMYTLTFEL